MFRHGFTLVTLGALLCGGLLGSCFRAQAADNETGVVIDDPSSLKVQIEDLHPFTHFALIPVGSDVSTIRFENAKTVKVPTKIIYTRDRDYDAEVAFRDPGGSMYYPRMQTESPTTAYEITYSFRGQLLASDEYGARYSVFHVYFRPNELAPEVRKALSARKLGRTETADYFTVKTSREAVQRVVIDETRSSFCDAIVRDGLWTQTDPDCLDRINYKTITTPSDYITVRVDPVWPR
jgi:hypothetical protein